MFAVFVAVAMPVATFAAEVKIENDAWIRGVDDEVVCRQGGGIFRFGDAWYRYGVDYPVAHEFASNSVRTAKGTYDGARVVAFVSRDFVQWEAKGSVVADGEIPPGWLGRMGAAKIGETYAIIIQTALGVSVYTAAAPLGPFRHSHELDFTGITGFKGTGDQTVFADEDTGKYYLVFSKPKGRDRTFVGELGMCEDGRIGIICWKEVFSGFNREANCMFKRGGRYYLCASNIYGWDASLTYWLVGDTPFGPFERAKGADMNVMVGCERDYSHVSQVGFFYTLRGANGRELVLYYGDRWTQWADNGKGFEVCEPITFDESGAPRFHSLSSWWLDPKAATWRVADDNNWCLNGSFDADRRLLPLANKPRQEHITGWKVEVVKGNRIALDNPDSPRLNAPNSVSDRAFVSGKFALSISDKAPFRRRVSQKIAGLPDGEYTLSYMIDEGAGWRRRMETLVATNSQCEITFDRTVPCRIDDVTLTRESDSGHTVALAGGDCAKSCLYGSFRNPPPEIKVGCYYYWVNERVDPVGVRKDLEWMKENGITRAFLATDIRNHTRWENPWEGQGFGDNEFWSEKWWNNLRTALKTAGELGIEMGIFNCPGWSQSGGPWVKPEESMRNWCATNERHWVVADAPKGGGPAMNGPCSPKASGLEVDKLSAKHVRKHFDSFIGEILRRIPKEERPTLTTVVVDSWERGRQNYTDDIFERFKARFGYDLDYADRKCDKDLRRLLAELAASEYMGTLTKCAHENGLITWCEPYAHSTTIIDGISYGMAADEVSAEFWASGRDRVQEIRNSVGAARKSGKNKVYAESFTSGDWKKWAKDDWSFAKLKPVADKFFHQGVNATILHVIISQPGDDSAPPVRPWFGTFFDRRSKNAADTKRLVDYCRRCNFMLQQGKPHDGKTDERILNDGTIIRFTSDSLFELTFPDGHQELWNPEQPSVAQRRGDAEGAKELRDSAGDIHPPSTGGYEGKRDDPQPDVRRSPGRFYLYNHN